jgi:hypothetical protein
MVAITLKASEQWRCPIKVSQEETKTDFTLKNDLAVRVVVATEKSTTALESSAVYRFEKNAGEKIFLIRKNEPKKLLITVQKSHKGKTFNISQLL